MIAIDHACLCTHCFMLGTETKALAREPPLVCESSDASLCISTKITGKSETVPYIGDAEIRCLVIDQRSNRLEPGGSPLFQTAYLDL